VSGWVGLVRVTDHAVPALLAADWKLQAVVLARAQVSAAGTGQVRARRQSESQSRIGVVVAEALVEEQAVVVPAGG